MLVLEGAPVLDRSVLVSFAALLLFDDALGSVCALSCAAPSLLGAFLLKVDSKRAALLLFDDALGSACALSCAAPLLLGAFLLDVDSKCVNVIMADGLPSRQLSRARPSRAACVNTRATIRVATANTIVHCRQAPVRLCCRGGMLMVSRFLSTELHSSPRKPP